MQNLLTVRNLNVSFTRKNVAPIRAVRDVSFTVGEAETVVILGESGSGKSVTAQTILGLHNPQRTRVTAEQLSLGNVDLLAPEIRQVRGRDVSMVFQDALSALNPVQRVGHQIAEMFEVHTNMSRREARAQAVELMREVHIPDAERRARNYPHELSGGMRQRIVIAMALALTPKLLIADEPTTALDVTVQLQILELLRKRCSEEGMSLLMITHDVGVAAEMADRIVVMYAGKIVEDGTVEEVLLNPQHPYTEGLLDSVPRADLKTIPKPIEGGLPDPQHIPAGCVYAPRCPIAIDACFGVEPEIQTGQTGRQVACHLRNLDEPKGVTA